MLFFCDKSGEIYTKLEKPIMFFIWEAWLAFSFGKEKWKEETKW